MTKRSLVGLMNVVLIYGGLIIFIDKDYNDENSN